MSEIEYILNPDGTPGETWPVVTGCTKRGAGCKNCWACKLAATRLKNRPDYAGLANRQPDGTYNWVTHPRFNHHHLDKPRRWRKPRTVFVASTGDLFHASIHRQQIVRVLDTIRDTPQHWYYIFTKRIRRANEIMSVIDYPDNAIFVWSASNQSEVDAEIHWLLTLDAAYLGISLEPLLERVIIPTEQLKMLDWAAIGLESAAKGLDRDVSVADTLETADQFCEAGVPLYFKQWGTHKARDLGLNNNRGADPDEWKKVVPSWQLALLRRDLPIGLANKVSVCP